MCSFGDVACNELKKVGCLPHRLAEHGDDNGADVRAEGGGAEDAKGGAGGGADAWAGFERRREVQRSERK